MITSHKQIVELWPTTAEFAEETGIHPVTARVMKARGKIPSWYWTQVVEAAQKRGFTEVTADQLAATQRPHRIVNPSTAAE